MTDLLRSLRTVMYELFYIDDINTFTGIDTEAFHRLQALYPPERIERFRLALEWAMTCPDFNFNSLLPNLPHTNEQILTYLTRYHQTLEQHATTAGWPRISLST